MIDQFIGQTLADKYRIEEVMRENGSGTLYRATHLLMEKPVAVKILSPTLAADNGYVKRFSAEARTVSRIAHPNVLNVTDFGTDKNGAVFTVFENAEGETLREAIAREGKFSLERTVKTIRQIAAALSAAHSRGVVHGHLNSENILLAGTSDENELVKVLDFGSTESKENNRSDESYAKNFEYLSPEQNSAVSEADERSDVYSLGVIFYEMLTGQVPFSAASPAELALKQAENPPAPISSFRGDLPESIEPIILHSLAKNPEMRYQTVGEFTDDLNRAAKDFGETVIVSNQSSVADNTTNNLWKTAFVVLAGVSLLAIGLIYATSVKQTNIPTQMQTDANGQPVQPLNPATGMNEQGLSNMMSSAPAMMGNSNMTVPQAVPNGDGFGDGYNPWARGGQPPPGAPPQYIPPGGQMIDPNNPNSIFMQDGTVLVPVPANTNANVKPSPTPSGKQTPAPVNTQPSPTPTTNPKATPNASPTPAPKTEKTPAKPAEKPKPSPPASTVKPKQSGQAQNS